MRELKDILYARVRAPLRNIIAGIPRTLSGKMEDDDVAKDCRVTWHQQSRPDACSHMRGVLGTQSARHNEEERTRAREIMTRNLARLISLAERAQSGGGPQVIAAVLINNKLTYANEAKRRSEGPRGGGDRGGILT